MPNQEEKVSETRTEADEFEDRDPGDEVTVADHKGGRERATGARCTSSLDRYVHLSPRCRARSIDSVRSASKQAHEPTGERTLTETRSTM